ncbi:MAG: bifunctional methylenetetrahydrofolate dehydrogenase/methenyltetrahydrofolate cyclohydrolase FolD [Euryarchaeota archaeon]|nr:bifunctional methylenetetrahydrofolate dehydrogenase/methenyltetrahydrofolate cyclohydrolase FolD [Euryarchaeota archaeon]MBT7938233.1 bifunctional methylenetetrahydrofolate dehydrogenase/methenyltetrahydrofolate cyclohydrolase FolD [Euryarchaeota archaeon]
MVAKRLDGKACAENVEANLKERISSLKSKGVNPHLVVIIVGDDPASKIYVGAKERACERLGIVSTRHSLSANTSEAELRDLLSKLNADDSVHGILVQSPLPDGLDELGLTDMIDPNKDVDGFHPVNLGRLVQGRMDGHLPCTPAGVMRMLEWANVDLNGKRAVVIGRSRIVGMPLSLMLAAKGSNATVSIVHSRTENIEAHCQQADILIAAVGVAGLVKSNWVKNGAVVIDVGVNRVEDSSRERGWSLAGDVAPDVSEVASILSPVPGGVGPMTIAMLMSNTVKAAEKLSR